MEHSTNNNLTYPPEEQRNPFLLFFTNLLSSIKLPFPPKNKSKPAPSDSPAIDTLKLTSPAAVDDESKPGFVTLRRQNLEPIKLDLEADVAEQTSNPLILWQVYALGGFLVLRWALMRWNERKGQKKSDNDPSPAHD